MYLTLPEIQMPIYVQLDMQILYYRCCNKKMQLDIFLKRYMYKDK